MNVDEFIPKDCIELPFREDICYPVRKSLEISAIEANLALKKACIDYRGWPYVFYLEGSKCPPQNAENKIFALTKEPFYNYKKFNFWSFNYKDQIFYSKNLTDEASFGINKLIDPELQVKIIAEILLSCGRIFNNLGYPLKDELVIGLRFINIRNWKVGSTDMMTNFYYQSTEYFGEKIEIKKVFTLSNLLNQTSKLSAIITKELITQMGCTRYPNESKFIKYAEERLKDGKQI